MDLTESHRITSVDPREVDETRPSGPVHVSLTPKIVAFAALAGLGALVIPPLISAATSFVEALPGYLRDLDAGRGPLAFLERRFHLGERLVEIYERGGIAALVGLERPGASTARAAVDTALAVVAVPFLTFFMLLDGKRWVDGALDVLPPGARPRWERVCDGIYRPSADT